MNQHSSEVPSPDAPNNTASTTIFDEMVDREPYEKSVKNARTGLYVLAGLQVAIGLYEYFTIDDAFLAGIALAIDAGIGAVFLALALWSRKKPVPAFLTALIFYIVVHAGFMMLDPSVFFKGIIFKAFVIYGLYKAYASAKEYEKFKTTIGQ